MRDRDASLFGEVAAAAGGTHGVVAHRQLIAFGVTSSTVQRWVEGGRLHRLYLGVYAVGHTALTAHGRWLAGVLACGPDAVLSHQPAAALLDLRRTSSPAIHVTTPRRANPRGITVHRVRHLHAEDVTERDCIPVTGVARTLLDLAGVLRLRQLIRAIEQAERLGVFDLRAIERLLARSRGRKGTGVLQAAIAAVNGEAPFTNSDWERDLLDFCDDHDIPRPELNVLIEGFLVDALWRDLKLIVELDSWTHHRSKRAFEEDRLKYAKLQLAGYRVLPLTKLDDAAAELLSAAVAAR
jgi:hypothetical protein